MDFSRWSMDKALRDGYEINEWVHACINVKARHAASVPWRVSEFAGSEEKAAYEHERKGIPASELPFFLKDSHRVRRRFTGYKGLQPVYERKAHLRARPQDPLEQLLEEPNQYNTRYDYIERLIQHLELSGNAMWVKLRGKVLGMPGYKTPFELWPLFPQSVEVERDGQVPLKYHYYPDGKLVNESTEGHYDPADVIHFGYPAPGDALWGMSPLMAAARSVDTDSMSARFQLNSMSNRGVTDYLISFEEKLSKKDYMQARKMMRENRTGPDNARAPWLLGNSARVQQLSLSPVELDYIRTRGFNRQAICSIFNVYPPVIAVMEGYGLSSVDTILKHHWTQTMIPLLDKLQAVLNQSLAAEFPGNRLAWYDPSNVEALNQSLMDRYRMQKVVHTEGIPMTKLNDRFDLGLDLEGVVGADIGWFPAGVTPAHIAILGSDPGNANTNTPAEGGDPGEPGDFVEPNEPHPEDIPDDGSQEGISDPEAASGWAYFENGHADPHGGLKRWALDEAADALRERGIEVDLNSVIRESDYFVFPIEGDAASSLADLAGKEGEGVIAEDLPTGLAVRFYNGREVEQRRARLLELVKSWG